MPEDKKKEELTVDIDSSGPDTEVEIKEEKTEGEVQDETTQDSNKSDDTPAESDKQPDVQDSEPEKKEEVKEEPAQKEQKKEMEEYSEGVQKRIAKLTRKMREAERQKEEAVTYAKRVMRERDALTHTATTLDRDYAVEMENRIKSSLAAAQAKLGTSRAADDKKVTSVKHCSRRGLSGIVALVSGDNV